MQNGNSIITTTLDNIPSPMAGGLPSLHDRLSAPSRSHAECISLARDIRSNGDLNLRPLRAAFLSTFSIQLMEPLLTVELAAQGFLLDAFFGPFNQFEQLVLEAESDLYRSAPEMIVLSIRPEDSHPEPLCRLTGLSEADRVSIREDIVGRIENLIAAIRRNTPVPIILWNMAEPARLAAGFADASLESSDQQFVADVNKRIAETSRRTPNTYVFDLHRASCEIGLRNLYDLRLAYVARMPFSHLAQAHLARSHAKVLALQKSSTKKCIVLDLDNTLWGGVVGEDGLEGIALGEDYPGSAFVGFQRYLTSLRSRGILLAIASKNNERDALDVLENHPASTLRADDFSDLQIHWEDKATSIRNISKNLNIGLESIAFFDDNPVERSWVRSQLPEVHVFDVPNSPMEYSNVVESSGLFDILNVTDEDLERAELYRIDGQRRFSSRSFESSEDFLRSLDTIVSHGLLEVDSPQFRRVVQLLGRTNQFNLTTRRHTAADLHHFLHSGAIGIHISVSDRFGSHGLVGFALAVPATEFRSPDGWRIDSFLLSCRVMGRRIESALLRLMVDKIRERSSHAAIVGEFIPTEKNTPTRSFYPDHAFEKLDESPNLIRYHLDATILPEMPDIYRLRAE